MKIPLVNQREAGAQPTSEVPQAQGMGTTRNEEGSYGSTVCVRWIFRWNGYHQRRHSGGLKRPDDGGPFATFKLNRWPTLPSRWTVRRLPSRVRIKRTGNPAGRQKPT